MNQTPAPEWQPSEEQLERQKRLRRSNWLTLYTPLILMGVVGLGLIGALLWATWGLEPDDQVNDWRLFASATADLIMIATSLFALLSCLLIPLVVLGGTYFGASQGWRPITQLQTLLWRLELRLDGIQARVNRSSDTVAKQTIEARSGWAKVEAWFVWIRFRFLGR